MTSNPEELKPFLKILSKKHPVPRHISFDINCGVDVYESMIDILQTLSDANDVEGFHAAKAKFEASGEYKFRVTDTEVFLYKVDPNVTIDLDVAVQVKGSSITWYFLTPGVKDEYSQDFRDILFSGAAKAHSEVERGCGLYYRGSNAFHVKTMHTHEIEAFYNHNHYRVLDASVTANDFAQHMRGISHQTELQDWFEPGEIENIIGEYGEFYQKWTRKEEESGLSAEERYAQRADQQLSKADIIEFHLFGTFQEPCRINVDELKADYDRERCRIEGALEICEVETTRNELSEALKKIEDQRNKILSLRSKGGSRGGGSELAMTRQVADSVLPAIEVVPVKDDKVVEIIDFREASWAKEANKEVDRTIAAMLEAYENVSTVTEQDNLEIQRLLRISKQAKEKLGEELHAKASDSGRERAFSSEQSSKQSSGQSSPSEIRRRIKEQKSQFLKQDESPQLQAAREKIQEEEIANARRLENFVMLAQKEGQAKLDATIRNLSAEEFAKLDKLVELKKAIYDMSDDLSTKYTAINQAISMRKSLEPTGEIPIISSATTTNSSSVDTTHITQSMRDMMKQKKDSDTDSSNQNKNPFNLG